MKNVYLFLILLLSLGFTSCKKDTEADKVADTQKRLKGRWNLVIHRTNTYEKGTNKLLTEDVYPGFNGDYKDYTDTECHVHRYNQTKEIYTYTLTDDKHYTLHQNGQMVSTWEIEAMTPNMLVINSESTDGNGNKVITEESHNK